MSDRVPPELALAVMCCRWPFGEDARQRVRETAERVADWEQFAGIIKRNRVRPLAYRALTLAGAHLPESISGILLEGARAAASRGLLQARESLRLQEAFEAADLTSMIVKGSPLAILAYGDLGIKESCDVDILVMPHDVLAAREQLLGLGYRSNVGTLQPEVFEQMVKHGKEAQFLHPGKGVSVDLHWRLIDYRRLMYGIDVHGPSQTVAVPGGALRTLANEPLFAHLCLHGAVHGWMRLKWLADLNAFIGGRSAEEVEHLHDAARRYGVGRSASLAISLSERLFGFRPSPALRRSLENSAVTRSLAGATLAGLAYRGGAVEHDNYTMPWLQATLGRFILAPGYAHVFEHVRVTWNLPEDRARLPLPPRLAFLYHLLRIPMWLGRLYRRAHRQVAT